MPLTMEQLTNAGFAQENFPPELPAPSPETIHMSALEGTHELFRYQANMDGRDYAMEIVIDRSTIDDPAEGVNFMLNQLGYLWRTGKEKLLVAADGSCRRINF